MSRTCALCHKKIDRYATCAKCQRAFCHSHMKTSGLIGGSVCPACLPRCYMCGDIAEERCRRCKKYICRAHTGRGRQVLCKPCAQALELKRGI